VIGEFVGGSIIGYSGVMSKVYHLVRGDFKGKTLHPLSSLKGQYPDVYEEHIKKYEGRKHITETFIPQLECYWGDVIHLSAVHPQKLVETLHTAGVDKQFSYFEIDAGALDPKKTIIYLNTAKEGKRTVTKDDFVPFDAETVGEWGYIPDETVAYYKKKLAEGKNPLLFLFVPHVLYKGSIDVSGLVLKKTT